MGLSRRAIGAIALAALFALLLAAPRGEAAFPGKNGLIAFDSDRLGSVDLFVMRSDGGGAFRVFGTGADDVAFGPFDAAPVWAREGGTLAFYSNRSGGSFDIWTVNLNGSGLKNLTPGLLFDDTDPAWSYDGQRIVFETASDIGGDRDIAVMSADGGGFKLLTIDPPFEEMEGDPSPPQQDQNPVFSLDGTRIFFQSDLNSPGLPQIFSMNSNGGDFRQLTFPPGFSGDPDISADGTEVIFSSDRHGPGGPTDTYVMNVDGTNPRRLVSIAGDEFRPVFSPDGKRAALTNFAAGSFQGDIVGVNIGSLALSAFSNPASDANPDWQPSRYKCHHETPTIIGSDADESIVGTQGEDVIVGLGGDDTIKGLAGNDIICGGEGNDIINGGRGDDILRGNKQGDKLKGKKGADALFGGAPKATKKRKDPDKCRGGKGPDNIKGCAKNTS